MVVRLYFPLVLVNKKDEKEKATIAIAKFVYLVQERK